ncbi:MAG: thrombospondin type 3 repeat-containing protein [Anaerolineae bacterium]|nr:thrombospondin type 3 repeat-containing protein [Anaerolineae bacterium]
MSERPFKVAAIVLVLVAACLLVAVAGLVGYSMLQRQQSERQAEGGPAVQFSSPPAGEPVAVGEMVVVHAVASDPAQVTRVELWIDGQLHQAQDTTLPGGISPFPLVSYWQPSAAGMHTLTARAFNAQGAHAQAVLVTEAVAEADRDGDGSPDGVDACPDEAGWQSTAGCPDRDGDAIADASDACPDAAGLPAGGGCPMGGAGDRDGDGVPDEADACPDTPGMPALDGCPMPGDRDGDEIPDDRDACPDTPGSAELEGCPDRDGDGVRDGDDACPDVPGPPPSGCPAPAEGDRDGDGFPDGEDMCPDEPGVPATWGCPDRDGDGVRDSEDECPDEAGLPENRGCPAGAGPGGEDSDGDGTPDEVDPCPDEPGPPEHDGCPDSDGDGIPDWWDRCPDEPGTPEGVGCPGSGVGDRDGDGAPDDVDLCPDEAGLPEHGGCPPPVEEMEEGIVPGPGEAEWPGEIPIAVEFQALSFQVSDEYDGVYCYPSLAGGGVERYEFAPLGLQQWDIAADLGSRMLATALDQPIDVQMECGADVIFEGDESAWGTYWSIGSVAASHPSADWDGHVITVRSADGDEGRWFEAQYRLCVNTCDETAFPAPLLALNHGRDDLLIWQWDGDMGRLAGYRIYRDGSSIAMVGRSADPIRVLIANRWQPLCGRRHEFSVTAFGEDGRESPHSNVVAWEGEACPRVVRVTFESITTFDLGDDEWWADGESVGSIVGNFWASGSTDQRLEFSAVDYGEWAGERMRGYRLRHNQTYSIQEIFDQIWTWIAGSMSSPYRVPDHNTVTVELGPDDDLTFGGLIVDADTGNPSDTLFDGQHTMPAGEVVPGVYTIRDRNIELTVLVDVIVGPEVGDLPDLVITNVDAHESGQLRIHVFNNAAPLVSQDIEVNLVRISANTQVGVFTWEDVTIPSGGALTLQLAEPLLEPYDLRAILDPANHIPEMYDGNNIFETPVVVRVEFLEARGAHCSESGCSIFDCDSEWVFSLWAGYGPSASDVTWVAFHERFPRSDDLVACSHDACMGHASSDEDWRMEGDDRYAFEFEMPAGENVYVLVTGYESDVWTSDDPFASPIYQYASRDGWGARDDPYTGYLLAESSCNDAFCSECGDQSVSARWRITRVH